MCIIFFYTNPNHVSNHYRLILSFNRDEFYDRQTTEADYWKTYPSVIGGRDVQSESNGTWLAASTSGKLGALLNITEKPLVGHSESRGVLVSNFVIGNISAMKYIQELVDSEKRYNGYHLILFDVKKNDIETVLHTNTNRGTSSEVLKLISGVHGLSNSRICTPYEKVNFGEQKFKEIIERFNTTDQRNSLVSELLNLLKSEIRHYPDNVLCESKKHLMPASKIEKLSSIFVKIPECNYGTRTHTIIMIDSENVMDYREYTMVDRSNDNPKWSSKEFTIPLNI